MGVSKNRGTRKSSILTGFSIINHPFWDTTIFGNIHIDIQTFPTVFMATRNSGEQKNQLLKMMFFLLLAMFIEKKVEDKITSNFPATKWGPFGRSL